MSETQENRADCPHCRRGPETYWYMKHRYLFDVDLARQLVQDGREPVEVDEASVKQSVAWTVIYPEHIRHVNTKYPGIITHVWFPLESGERVHGHLLIDGNHRAARCLEEGIPFFAHVLTEEESLQIVLKSPEMADAEPVAC
jgi:hypothetical protein